MGKRPLLNVLFPYRESHKPNGSKKSLTGPTERTPQPEYLIARSQLTEWGPLVRSHSNYAWNGRSFYITQMLDVLEKYLSSHFQLFMWPFFAFHVGPIIHPFRAFGIRIPY